MKYNIVAPIGGNLESTYVAVREFPTEKVYLLQTGKTNEKVGELRKVLANFKIPLQIVEVKGGLMEGTFRALAQIRSAVNDDSILVNVSSGDNMPNCATLAAAYVNGLKAFSVDADKIMMLPVLKFSYYHLLPERKLAILRFLKGQPDCCSSLEELAAKLKMSLPLCSYHINGNAKAEGLVSLGLAEVHVGPHGKSKVILTEMGRLIAEGLIDASVSPEGATMQVTA